MNDRSSLHLRPMPTVEDLRGRGLGAARTAVCCALVQHGINPDNMPAAEDALTPNGYLLMTGRLTPDGNGVETDFHPWPTPETWEAIRAEIGAAVEELTSNPSSKEQSA